MSRSKRALVVGGGIIGAACAYHLAKRGRVVTLIDKAGFGEGCSHANCGYVCPSHVLPLAAPGALGSTLKLALGRNSPIRIRLGVVLRDLGWFLRFARRCTRSHMLSAGHSIRALLASSRNLYDEFMADEAVDCEWETNGLLFVFRSQHAMDHFAETDSLLQGEFETPADRLDAHALSTLEPSLRPGLAGAWRYRGDAHLKPDRLMTEYRRILSKQGVDIREQSVVSGLIRRNHRAAGVMTSQGDFLADDIVFATGAWTPKLRRELGCQVPIQPGKGYSVTYERPRNSPSSPMIFEEDRVAITPFRTKLRIGSTMEFAGYDEGLNQRRLKYLRDTAASYLTDFSAGPFDEEWWGWRPMTPDGMPLIGRVPALENVWLAAGHNMLGLSMAPATGKLVSELICGAAPHIDPAPYAVNRC